MYLTLAKYLIDRPIVTNVMVVMVVGLGVLSGMQIQRLGYPNVDFKQVAITTALPGASPEGVELNVTSRLEDALRDVDGIDSYTSESSEGLSQIIIKIDPDADDPNKVKTDIRSAMDAITDLPDEMEGRPQIFELKNENFSIYEVALTSETEDDAELRRHADELRDLIKQIPEVTKVYEAGATEPEIRIELDAAKLRTYNVSLNQVVTAIKDNKIRLGAGEVKSGSQNKSVITVAEFADLSELRQLVVRSTSSGRGITLGMLGSIREGHSERETITHYNGKRGQSLWVVKKGSADVIHTIDKIKAEVDFYRKHHATDDLRIFSTWDMSIDTKNRLRIVTGNVALGFILVILVLFLFLDWRVAIWSAVGIPICISVAALIMPFFDISINTVSLCGMVVVLGMIVDDAIIVAESIYQQMERGIAAAEAAYAGLKVVIKPVLGTILTTLVAFFPIYYIPGLIGSFSYEIPSIVIIMLTASFVEATLMLPCHLAHGRGEAQLREPPLAFLMHVFRLHYQRLLKLTLRFRYWVTLAYVVIITITSLYAFSNLRFNMFPRDQAFRLWIRAELPEGTPLAKTSATAVAIEQMVRGYGDVIHSTKVTAGAGRQITSNQVNALTLLVIMSQATEREQTAEQFQLQLLERLRSKEFPQLQKVDSWIESGGPFLGRPIEIRVISNDDQKRRQAVEELKLRLPSYHLTEIAEDDEQGKQQVFIEPRMGAISKAGVSGRAIATTIRTAFNGTIAGYRQTTEDRIPYRVMLAPESQNFDNPLAGLLVENQFGNLVPVPPLVHQDLRSPPRVIRHHEGERLSTITANVDLSKTTPKAVHETLRQDLSQFARQYPGLKVNVGGEGEESSRMVNRIYILLAGAIAAIYLILVVQFNSLTQPLMVLLGIPFGGVGVALAFGIQGLDMSLLAAVGAVGFCGVVVNDSLIMVDYINQLRQETTANSFLNQIIEGAVARFRPIVLTTISTVAGLVPTAYGLIGGLDSFISPLVMAMMWGLLAGTPAILFIIPCLYAINHDVVSRLRT